MNTDLLRDPIERRTFVERCARYAFGLTILPALSRNLSAAEKAAEVSSLARGSGFAKAQRVIFIELQGGLSHIDSFDPKTGDTKGPGSAISTKAGYQLTEYLPATAKIADKITVIRSMTAKVGVHANAQYLMRTGYEKRGTIVHPMLGAWAQHYLGKSHPTLPSTVCVNRPANHGNGYFPAAFSPLPILDPDQGLANAVAPVSADVQEKRLGLLAQLDATFSKKSGDENVKAYGDFYDTTMALMKSSDLKAFDLSAESAATRDSYGRNKFGQGCLLARRLIQNGVRFVEVQSGGWDMHKQLADSMEDRGGEFDRTFAALVADLDALGLLDSTLVCVTTEFGRKPSFDGSGRGHHPLSFSTVLAGGGTKRGYVHGSSDAKGYEPDEKPMTVGSFHATIAWAAGLPIEKEMITPSGRPMGVGNKGKPALEVFA
ncbi:MAG TPA: DUF1501 domain-containing protein [Chthoniobacteraceae bacterium]|jgi:hypothetical protein|nr:DUF1501 domain-containing protein [Chthoniobacteraceae bacterium]